ncbi:MAG: hypothetical protein KF900_00655 [Bacteroidetes bacterium]|nr:hypothetical protein [Bacteroidota bacterium]
MKNVLAVLVIGFLVSACERPRSCTMMACIGTPPSITVKLQGFSETDLSHVAIVFLDTHSFSPKDSLIFSNGETNTTIPNEYMIGGLFGGTQELSAYRYLVKTNVSSDTIHQIKYDYYKESIPCNQCSDGGYEYQTVTKFRNFNFLLNQTKFVDTTVLTITK